MMHRQQPTKANRSAVPIDRLVIAAGAFAAFAGVGAGAFGAHALRGTLSEQMLAIWHTAVLYHLVHALALVAVGAILHWLPGSGWLRLSAVLLAAGIVIFSGSLYLLALTGQRWLGAVTPGGGLAFLLGWAALAIAMFTARA